MSREGSGKLLMEDPESEKPTKESWDRFFSFLSELTLEASKRWSDDFWTPERVKMTVDSYNKGDSLLRIQRGLSASGYEDNFPIDHVLERLRSKGHTPRQLKSLSDCLQGLRYDDYEESYLRDRRRNQTGSDDLCSWYYSFEDAETGSTSPSNSVDDWEFEGAKSGSTLPSNSLGSEGVQTISNPHHTRRYRVLQKWKTCHGG